MGQLRITWVEGAAPNHLRVTQVYGFCFSHNGRILLIEESGQFGLPGGKPEGQENYEETLRREVLEEAQAVIGEVVLLGYQLVEGDLDLLEGAPYAQLRAIAPLQELFPSAADPSSGRVYRRILCAPTAASGLLRWGGNGEKQVAAAWRRAQQIWDLSHCEPEGTSSNLEPV